VVLPDRLHYVIELLPGDSDFALWQRRFWEHLIRGERDFAAHMDYLHFNPVKHGYVSRVAD